MKDINDLKKRLKEDKEFRELFANKKNVSELIQIARENGYDVSEEELGRDKELSEDALEAVAGGSKKEDIDVCEHNIYS